VSTLRTAALEDAFAIHALIVAHQAEGHLLPRELDEIGRHVNRFVVVEEDDRVVACAELAPLSREVGEVRSLVVSRDVRSGGLGRQLIDELMDRSASAGFQKLCAFTHAPSYFVRLGFSIVPHVWVPEKIVTTCHACPQFRRCGQYAVVYSLTRPAQADTATQPRETFVPLAALHA
jgi:amino-acid N-acetyltransferase